MNNDRDSLDQFFDRLVSGAHTEAAQKRLESRRLKAEENGASEARTSNSPAGG